MASLKRRELLRGLTGRAMGVGGLLLLGGVERLPDATIAAGAVAREVVDADADADAEAA